MAKNWAITIGINQYDYLQPLNYAKRDAELIQQFLRTEARFDKIFFFTDDSPEIGGKSTRPTRANLRRVFLELFHQPFMSAGDNFWFFFSGHGMRHAERDYLMPLDASPADIEETAIPINFVTERLRRCGADNVVLILDACRSLGTRAGEGIGRQTAQEARQQGVISIFSCSPQEYSYEIEALQQGAFTTALLEGLGIQGQCATVERLNQYLNFRVPELVRQHKNARQTPYVIAEPVNKSHLILVPQYATLADIATLKIDAYQAEVNRNLDLAEQLWIRVLATALGQDIEAVKALQRIETLRNTLYNPAHPNLPQPQSQKPVPEQETQPHPVQGLSIQQKRGLEKRQDTLTFQQEWNIRHPKKKQIVPVEPQETPLVIEPQEQPLAISSIDCHNTQKVRFKTFITQIFSPSQPQQSFNLVRRLVIQTIGFIGTGLGLVIVVKFVLFQKNLPRNPVNSTTQNTALSAEKISTPKPKSIFESPIKQKIVVDLSDRRAYVYRGEIVQASFPVAVGKKGWETPQGSFQVTDMQHNPVFRHFITQKVFEPGSDNPLGKRWIGFWTDGRNEIGFHGTPDTELVGKAVSHGSLRMYNEDVVKLYEMVNIGTTVLVRD
jgi:uncharacterized caspase-like protein/lipoprotein-anchoring transpeptidase ErfK/SrfK